MVRVAAKAPPERVAKRLIKACEPWDRASYRKGGVFLLRFRGSGFSLSKNGGRGRTRPQRVFRGKIRTSGRGAEITGRFGMMARDRLLVYLPAQIMALFAAYMTPVLETRFAAVLWIAVLLCSAVLIGSMTVMDTLMGAERQKEMMELLQRIGEQNP